MSELQSKGFGYLSISRSRGDRIIVGGVEIIVIDTHSHYVRIGVRTDGSTPIVKSGPPDGWVPLHNGQPIKENCESKRGYTEFDAKSLIQKKLVTDRIHLRSYLCDKCNLWHVTSRTKAPRRQGATAKEVG